MNKRCWKCAITKPLSEFHRDRNRRSGRSSRCKSCAAITSAAHWQKIKDDPAAVKKNHGKAKYEYKGDRKSWHGQTYRDADRARKRRYYIEDHDGVRTRINKRRQFTRDTLSDTYIKLTLVKNSQLRATQIPQSLIETKREQLFLRRLARQLKQELTKGNAK